MTARWRRGWPSRVDRRVRWGVGAALLLVVLLQVGGGGVLVRLRTADLVVAVPAIAGLVAVHLLGAATWQFLQLRISGRAPAWSSAVRTYYAAQAIGGLTPANLGSDLYRLTALRSEVSWSTAAVPIIIQRVASSAALALIGMVGLSLVSIDVPSAGWIVAAVVGVVATGLAAAAALQWRAGPARSGTRLRAMRSWARPLAIAFVLGVAFHAISLLLFLVLVASLTPVAEPISVLAALSVARLSLLIPVTPSGLGVQEGLLVVLFVAIGLPAEVALAASVLARLALLVTTLVGAVMLIRGRSVAVRHAQPAPGGDALHGSDGVAPRGT
jgi:uncharacterized membrane protein YbhN (UPF0104 family)